MTQPKENVRVRRTKILLREALIELIEERGFETLTVGELTERALVSRAAFYRNYQDKYDLVEQIFEEAMSALLSAVGEMRLGHPPQVWVTFFEHIAEYNQLYRALLGKKGSPWFVRKMRASLAELVKAHEYLPNLAEPGHSDKPPVAMPFVVTFTDDLVPDLVSALLVEAITWWLEHEQAYTPEEIARRCALLVSALFKEVSTWE